ncbi:C40 family peptidase [Corynebacterium sp. TAE3-ERU12]|uniref:C40 family peptidase n=1 Tax=Corynebacterium sp. TAE3-ERU12 TaxID=2849491 RepID=UPI001C491A3C|nr:C40 family peptidase [Corynebacterium sp. TAE3-ERU12]MBV7296250.1 C40 family peptidase [Corynebacterium sp. TAE3-ERU12]
MGKHHNRGNFARNAAVAGATFASVTAMAIPAGASPLQEFGVPAEIDNLVEQGAGYASDISGVDVNRATDVINQAVGSSNFAEAAVAPKAISTGQRIVDAARSKIGSPYVWGATGPSSFDCSGLTSWAYSQVGKSIPRTSQAQASSGIPVARGAIAPGDIIAFYSGATHVGIYSGGNNVIHAPQAGDVVKEAPMNYMPYHSAVRY